MNITIKKPEYRIVVHNNDGLLTGYDTTLTLKDTSIGPTENLDDLNDVITGIPVDDAVLVYNANGGIYETRKLDYNDLTGTPDVGANTIDGGTF